MTKRRRKPKDDEEQSLGWIKLHRETLDSVVFKKAECFRAWMFILLKVNFKDSKELIDYKSRVVKKGTGIFSKVGMAKQLRCSEGKITRILNLLQNEEQIKVETTSKYTVIEVVNWSKYQDDKQIRRTVAEQSENSQGASEEQSNTTQTTDEEHSDTNNNDNNSNNDKNDKNSPADTAVTVWPTFDDFWNAYDKKIDRPKSEKLWEKLNQEAREKIMQHLEKYIPATPDKKFRKHPTTYLNNQGWNDEIIIRHEKLNDNDRQEFIKNELTIIQQHVSGA